MKQIFSALVRYEKRIGLLSYLSHIHHCRKKVPETRKERTFSCREISDAQIRVPSAELSCEWSSPLGQLYACDIDYFGRLPDSFWEGHSARWHFQFHEFKLLEFVLDRSKPLILFFIKYVLVQFPFQQEWVRRDLSKHWKVHLFYSF